MRGQRRFDICQKKSGLCFKASLNLSGKFDCINIPFADLLKGDVDKDKKRAATQAAFKKKFKKNSDFWVYEKKIRLVIRKAIKQQWFYWTVIVLGKL